MHLLRTEVYFGLWTKLFHAYKKTYNEKNHHKQLQNIQAQFCALFVKVLL